MPKWEFTDKDLGILCLTLIAFVWAVCGWSDGGTVVHDIVIAIAGVMTGTTLSKGENK